MLHGIALKQSSVRKITSSTQDPTRVGPVVLPLHIKVPCMLPIPEL
jgi:hypothetical protein